MNEVEQIKTALYKLAEIERMAHKIADERDELRLQRDELLGALEGLFEHCAMVHNRWGDNSNQRAADNAITQARAAIAKAKGNL